MYVLLALIIAAPLIWKLDFPIIASPAVKGAYNAVENIPDGKIAVISINWASGTIAENGPQTEAIIRHMFMKDKKRLGIHTEMFSDGVLDLVEQGVITGEDKSLHKGKMVATFLMGTKRLYDFVNNNPNVLMFPADYVNHPAVICQNHKMVSINSCVEVDLMGQVVSEAIGLKQISGVGGQVDYVRGTSMAKDGKSIIAVPSTAAKGTVSRIVPFLAEGAAVTTSRNDVDYIVTEYGIAHLRGKTLRQRAESLIAIAHPNFRAMLTDEFNKRF